MMNAALESRQPEEERAEYDAPHQAATTHDSPHAAAAAAAAAAAVAAAAASPTEEKGGRVPLSAAKRRSKQREAAALAAEVIFGMLSEENEAGVVGPTVRSPLLSLLTTHARPMNLELGLWELMAVEMATIVEEQGTFEACLSTCASALVLLTTAVEKEKRSSSDGIFSLRASGVFDEIDAALGGRNHPTCTSIEAAEVVPSMVPSILAARTKEGAFLSLFEEGAFPSPDGEGGGLHLSTLSSLLQVGLVEMNQHHDHYTPPGMRGRPISLPIFIHLGARRGESVLGAALLYPHSFQAFYGIEIDKVMHEKSLQSWAKAGSSSSSSSSSIEPLMLGLWDRVSLEQANWVMDLMDDDDDDDDDGTIFGCLRLGSGPPPCFVLVAGGLPECVMGRVAQDCLQLPPGSVLVTTLTPIGAYLPSAPPWTPGAQGIGIAEPRHFCHVLEKPMWWDGEVVNTFVSRL